MTPRPFRDEVHCDTAMLAWLRRQVNADLRYWRHGDHCIPAGRVEGLVADCKARLGMLANAEHWRSASWDDTPQIADTMTMQRMLVMAMTRRAFYGYRGRDGWRSEWDYRLR
jgi:hypothetical protein